MSDIVEKLAQYLYEDEACRWGESVSWDENDDEMQEFWRDEANKILQLIQPHITERQKEAMQVLSDGLKERVRMPDVENSPLYAGAAYALRYIQDVYQNWQAEQKRKV